MEGLLAQARQTVAAAALAYVAAVHGVQTVAPVEDA